MNTLSLVGILGTVGATFTADLNIKVCDASGCKLSPKRVALDSTSGGTEGLISVAGDAKDELTLKYGGSDIGGPRVYLIEEDGTNKNTMFLLNGQEFTFDVELSTMSCGFNAALYFVGMTDNKGEAETGTNYCDAQAVGGTFCSEMDIFEGNTVAQQFTTHACVDACASYTNGVSECKQGTQGVCDQSGCGLNPFRYGPGTSYNGETNNEGWHGVGSSFEIDTSKPFTVTTQFHASSISRFYLQNGKRIDLPALYVLPPTDGSHYAELESPAIKEDFCVDIYDRWDGETARTSWRDESDEEPLPQMLKNLENGVVLAMSAWYDQETYSNGKPSGTQTGMSWMDGVNNWGHYTKTGPCHETTSDAGDHQATFSDIRFGPIGTTVPSAPPAPTPAPTPAPAPTPGPSGSGECCYGGCSGGNCQAGWCGASQGNCENNCGGEWCPAVVV